MQHLSSGLYLIVESIDLIHKTFALFFDFLLGNRKCNGNVTHADAVTLVAQIGFLSRSVFRISSTNVTRCRVRVEDWFTGVDAMRFRIVRGIAYGSANVCSSIMRHGIPSAVAVS